MWYHIVVCGLSCDVSCEISCNILPSNVMFLCVMWCVRRHLVFKCDVILIVCHVMMWHLKLPSIGCHNVLCYAMCQVSNVSCDITFKRDVIMCWSYPSWCNHMCELFGESCNFIGYCIQIVTNHRHLYKKLLNIMHWWTDKKLYFIIIFEWSKTNYICYM